MEKSLLPQAILSAIYEKDKYTNEIYDFVKNVTKNDNKQINLYPTLKKLEDQKLISSYWNESDVGAKRHYYSITDFGKKTIDKWGKFTWQDFNIPNIKSNPTNDNINDNKIETNNDELSLNNQDEKANEIINDLLRNDVKTKSLYDYINSSTNNNLLDSFNNKTNFDKKTTNNKLFSNPEDFFKVVQDQHKNTSKIYNSHINKKENVSFVDDLKIIKQTNKEYSYETPIQDEKINYDRLNDFITENKKELDLNQDNENLNLKTYGDYNNKSIVDLNNYNFKNENKIIADLQSESSLNDSSPNTKTIKEDCVFITSNPIEYKAQKVKKIETPRFEMYISDYSISPSLDEKFKKISYKDRLQELYEQSKNNVDNRDLAKTSNKTEITFNSYEELEEFYKTEDIKLYIYNKTNKYNKFTE